MAQRWRGRRRQVLLRGRRISGTRSAAPAGPYLDQQLQRHAQNRGPLGTGAHGHSRPAFEWSQKSRYGHAGKSSPGRFRRRSHPGGQPHRGMEARPRLAREICGERRNRRHAGLNSELRSKVRGQNAKVKPGWNQFARGVALSSPPTQVEVRKIPRSVRSAGLHPPGAGMEEYPGSRPLPTWPRAAQSARCANDVEARLTLLLTYEGRTLLSVAFDVAVAIGFELEDQKNHPKTEINGDGQQCSSYLSQRQRQRRRVILSLYGWGSATKFGEDVLSGDVWVPDECA